MALNKPKKIEGEALKAYAVRLLGGRALSVGELKAKLRLKASKIEEIEPLIAQLKDYGYLNDSRFAEHFAGRRASSGNFGRQRVLADLAKKRVASKVAEKAVTEAYAGTSEADQVEQYLERKYRGKDLRSLLQDPKVLASVFRRLRTAGFGSGAAIRVLKRHAAEAEQLEGMEEGSAE